MWNVLFTLNKLLNIREKYCPRTICKFLFICRCKYIFAKYTKKAGRNTLHPVPHNQARSQTYEVYWNLQQHLRLQRNCFVHLGNHRQVSLLNKLCIPFVSHRSCFKLGSIQQRNDPKPLAGRKLRHSVSPALEVGTRGAITLIPKEQLPWEIIYVFYIGLFVIP